MGLCFALMSLAVLALAAEMTVHRDLHYVTPPGERQNLDVYAPKEGKDHPVVVWIHGGGWQSGDKAEVDAKPQAFVDRGYVLVSVNYRLLPAVTIQQMAKDVAKAIRWTHAHAGEYGGDPDTLFITGHSAGAQLAALLCTDDRYLKAEGIPLTLVKGCIPNDGDTYDVPLQIATVEERIAIRYRQKFGNEASQKELSPVTHVAKGKSIPPFLVLHVAEHPETRLQSRRLVEALKAAGFRAATYPAEGKNHVSLNADLGRPGDPPTAAMFEFLAEILRQRRETN